MRGFVNLKVFLGALYALLSLMALAGQDLVKVNMRGSVYYGRPRRRYGPGQGILVPRGLALTLGLKPVADNDATVAEVQTGEGQAGGGAEPQAGATNAGGQDGTDGDDSEDDDETSLEGIDGIGPELAAALAERGITTVEQFRGAGDARLLDIPGIGPKTLEKLRAATEG